MKTGKAFSPSDLQLISFLLSLVCLVHFPVIYQPPGDNGSKITNYLLEWDEVRVSPDGQHVMLMLLFNLLSSVSLTPPFSSSSASSLQGKKNSVFRECYFGSQRHCKLTRLYPTCGYTFRVAAHNDIGRRYKFQRRFARADIIRDETSQVSRVQ